MSNFIRVKVDVTKIDKDRLFRGAKGTYLDLVLIPTRESKYGETHLVKQDISKEEREAGVNLPILGNAKELAEEAADRPAVTKAAPSGSEDDWGGDDGLPF